MRVNYKCLNENAVELNRAYPYDAGWDLYASETTTLKPWGVVPTGLAIRIPRGYVGFIMSRSGLSAKEGVFVLNAPGVIDADYTAEIKIVMATLQKSYKVIKGDKIAQLIVMPLHDIYFLRGDNMVWGIATRGENGFGSSGN